MKNVRQQSDRIIHELKNLLSVLLLAIDNLAKDKKHILAQGPNLVSLADLVQELIVRVDDLAQVVATDSNSRSKCSASDQSKIIPIKGNFQAVRCPQPSGRAPRSADAVAIGPRTHPRVHPGHGQDIFS